MTLQEYKQERTKLMNEANAFLDSSEVDKANEKMAEIEALDMGFETEAKARASMEALSGRNFGGGFQNAMRRMDVSHMLDGATVGESFHVDGSAEAAEPEDPTNSTEYRKAFMNYVISGKPIPAQFKNANEKTFTEDVETVIPTTLINRIIEKIDTIGMILPLVTRTSYKTGIELPVSGVKPVATWVAEGAGSDRQKTTTGKITFTKHKLRCEIAWTMETDVMTIPAFEALFVRQVSEAMVKALETAIVSDSGGTGMPRGILAETPEAGQALDAAVLDFDLLNDAEAALPEAYDGSAIYFMSKKTFYAYARMVDENGQPIGNVTRGITGTYEHTLLGRRVVLVGDYLPSFSDSLAVGTIFAFLFDPKEYVLNTVYDMGIQRKQDWDTEDMLVKAVMSVDGKVIDKRSLVTISKKEII